MPLYNIKYDASSEFSAVIDNMCTRTQSQLRLFSVVMRWFDSFITPGKRSEVLLYTCVDIVRHCFVKAAKLLFWGVL